jgi:glycosyltransferase involved in cell wall biosynthesis
MDLADEATNKNTARWLVSIITPSYNQARFLRATLQSVASQDYPRIEHIVMDGGSTDGSREILEGWARGHDIDWQSKPDGGQASAIRQGIERARGDIVAWLNSDDVYLDKSVVSDVVRTFEGGVQVVTGAGWYIDEAGHRLRRISVQPAALEPSALRHVDAVLQPATFVRRELLLQCPIDERLHFAFDWDLFIRLRETAPFEVVDRDIAGYRLHGSGKTESGGVRRQRELLEVVGRYNGRRSRAYAQLAPIVVLHRLGAILPFGLARVAAVGLDRFAQLTQRAFPGRGIQN